MKHVRLHAKRSRKRDCLKQKLTMLCTFNGEPLSCVNGKTFCNEFQVEARKDFLFSPRENARTEQTHERAHKIALRHMESRMPQISNIKKREKFLPQ